MSIWTWIVIAAFSWTGFSLLVGLTIARVLGSISHRSSDLIDAEADTWVFAPLTREIEQRSGIDRTRRIAVGDHTVARRRARLGRHAERRAGRSPSRRFVHSAKRGGEFCH
jgi:hypothetical protein